MDRIMIFDREIKFVIETGAVVTVLDFDDHVTLVSPCLITYSTNPSVPWLTFDPTGPSLRIYTDDTQYEGVHTIEVIGTINTQPLTTSSFLLSVAISVNPCLNLNFDP